MVLLLAWIFLPNKECFICILLVQVCGHDKICLRLVDNLIIKSTDLKTLRILTTAKDKMGLIGIVFFRSKAAAFFAKSTIRRLLRSIGTAR